MCGVAGGHMLGLPKDPLPAQASQLGDRAILLHSLEKNLSVYGRVHPANLHNPKRHRARAELTFNAGDPFSADASGFDPVPLRGRYSHRDQARLREIELGRPITGVPQHAALYKFALSQMWLEHTLGDEGKGPQESIFPRTSNTLRWWLACFERHFAANGHTRLPRTLNRQSGKPDGLEKVPRRQAKVYRR